MGCKLAQSTVQGYFDAELEAQRASEFEHHLENCTECQAALQNMQSVRTGLQHSDLYEHAPFHLRSQLRSKLDLDNGSVRMPAILSRRLWIPALAILSLAVAFSVAFLLISSRLESERITAELTDAHARSLQPGHLTDTQSTDQHAVQLWFNGKVDFALPISDYSVQGFPLLGGRFDVIEGQNSAALVYARGRHLINLFAWRYDEAESFESSGSRKGYNWLMWQTGVIRFCLISDAATSDLQELKKLIHR